MTETPRFCIVLGQRASWPEMLARTRETESLGFDALFLVDHFYGLKDVADPTHEAYTMLAALAPFTQRIRLGVMVCGNTYRNPAFLLKQAITADHVSGGRVDFGVGAGWLQREHEAYGFPYPPAGERVDRFAEALEIWEQLQRNERTTFEGRYYQVLDAPFEPKSLQGGRLPLLIGASGKRMLRLVARYADAWNTVGSPEDAAAVSRRLDEACAAEGRDPATLVRSVSPGINLLASVEAFREGVDAYHAAGFRDIYLPWPRTDAEVPVLREVAQTVLPDYRKATAAASPGPGDRPAVRPISADDAALLRPVAAGLDETGRGFLSLLASQPEERFDGNALCAHLGLPDHAAATRAVATLGSTFAAAGFVRPWSEAQRGYALSPEMADLVKAALA